MPVNQSKIDLLKYNQPQNQKTAADWIRDLRFNNLVNKSTLGIDTDKVNPELMLAASSKLLKISRGESQGDPKDSLQYQRFYGPVEYFAEHIQKDAGSVARSLLWKATNKGTVLNIPTNALQPHINSVFNGSLAQFVDNSTPMDGVDNAMKVTRVGEGGVSSLDQVPILMRLVHPSYLGYIDPARCYSWDTLIYTKLGWKYLKDLTVKDIVACLVDNKLEWHRPDNINSYMYAGMMYCYEDLKIGFKITPRHRMYVKPANNLSFRIALILEVQLNTAPYTFLTVNQEDPANTQEYNISLNSYRNTYQIYYNGTVYCPTVPGGLVLVRRVSGFDREYGTTGFWCGNTALKCVTPETLVTCVDDDDNLYTVCAKDLTLKHRVLCNIDGEIRAEYPNLINVYDHDGPLFCYKNKDGVSFRVTEHHRLYITSSKKEAEEGNFHFELAADAYGKDFYLSVNALNGSLQTIFCPKTCWYILQYKGKVYCPTVPGGMIYITGLGNPLNKQSFWCGNSPGVTGYVTKNIMKGTDGKLYRPFYNTKTGKELLVDSQTAARSVVTTSEYKNSKDKYVYAVGGERGVRIVPYKDVNYILPYSDEMFSMSANAVPMASGAKPMRLLMGCLHPDTSIVFADEHGYTDIVPAKLLGDTAKTYLMGCTKNGLLQLQLMSKVVPRFPDRKKKFRRVILKSGRVLNTSHDHKWYIYDNKLFKLIRALNLKPGMIVPRSMFLSMPVRLTEILGVTFTKLMCTLMGCLMRSLLNSGKVYRFRYTLEQFSDIVKSFEQLSVISYNKYERNGVHYISLTDDRFLAWLDKEMHLLLSQRKVPKAVLSLPLGYTAYVLDAYSKDKLNIGYDTVGDVWLLDIPSAFMRDGLSFMLNKIYTDTIYHDFHSGDKLNRALLLTPAKSDLNDIVLDLIHAVIPMPNPGLMIDIDCNDNVYAAGNGIITHNSKYTNQAVSLQNRLASLVQSLDEASGKTMLQIIGKHLGTQWAPKAGVVQAVRKDRIDMLYDDGTKGSVPLYENFPSNTKGWITNYPQVKAGQHVSKDQLLASSNYTDDKGVAALGRNLRVAYMSYKGGTYLDGCILSLTGAKKMGYTTMYQTAMDLNKTIRTNKNLYHTWKPNQYSKLQLDNLDDDGLVKPGTVLHKGDPMILGIQTTEPSPGTMGKRLLTDVSMVWLHHYPGVVTDIARTKNGVKVLAQVSQPFQIGDKLSGFQGSKGTVARIIPDDQMPKDSKGRPILLLFDPLGIVSRCYDKDTEFLTQDGWKFGKDVLDTDILYCYNPDDDTCDWMPQQLSFHKQLYKGFMYGVYSDNLDFLVTVDHKVWVNINNSWQLKKIQDIYASLCMFPVAGFSKQLLEDPSESRVGTKELMDRLQQQFTVRGYWSQVLLIDALKKLYSLRVYSKETHSAVVKMQDWYKAYYEDMVYCPTVPTGYVVTRRHGKVVLSGNTNPSQMIEAALGKVALKTGKPIVVPQFSPNGQSRLLWAKSVLKQNNVPWKLTLTDPETGRQIKDIFVGVNYYLPLKHIADTKMSARGTGTYTSLQVPSSGGLEGCFPAMQDVLTIHGLRSIATICLKRIPLYVLSWDAEAKLWKWKQITDWFTYRAKTLNILNIFTLNAISTYGGRCSVKHTNSSYPTKNHKMYMADGSIKLAGLLKVGLYLAGLGCVYTEDQKQALLGTLMGDSCRTPDGGIQCMHSNKQVAYLNYKRAIFSAVGASKVSAPKLLKGTIKGRDGRIILYAPTSAVRMQIPKCYWVLKALLMTTDSAGKRHLTIPVLLAMGLFGFCLWFLDDGCMTDKSKGLLGKTSQPLARIATHSFSVLLVLEAAKWLLKNLLHILNSTHITIYKGVYNQDQPYLNFHRDASWLIARIVAKHIPWDVIPNSKAWLKQYCKQVQLKTPCVEHNFMSPLGIVPLKIKLIKPYKHDKPGVTLVNVYDFTVKDTHNYALTGGVNVSNSKRLGSLESAALVGHNAFDFLVTDAKLIRGQSNADFWRSIQTGTIPVIPGLPLVHKKFFNHLTAAGMRVQKNNKGISIMALTNKDVNLLAGNRQLKTRDTYLQKNFRPIDGGLFGQDIFGQNGDSWGYIQLDLPLPNPVMLLPLARILNIPVRDFKAVCLGKILINGMKNASDVKKALSKLDIRKQTMLALLQFKSAKNSAKDNALKRYVALAQMKDSGHTPDLYMLDRIPVLPPKFRPVSTHNGLTMVADSNYLYAQMLDARNDLRDAKDLPVLYQNKARLHLYNSWQLLVGLTDPSDMKLKSKNVGGLLKWALALGNTPKMSAFYRKVYGSTVDTVGRGVVVPDSRIKLNLIAMPWDMAWNVYAPFVTRKLVQANYTPVLAMKMVKAHADLAKPYLVEAMDERPVVMNRAPSLHKLSLMGFNVKPTTGTAIHVNPSIVVPYNMDFDGDCIWNTVLTEVALETIKHYPGFSKISDLTFLKSGVLYVLKDEKKSFSPENKLQENSNMFSKDTKMQFVTVTGTLEDLPHVEGSEVHKSDTVTEWDVPRGFYVSTLNPETGKLERAAITKVSKHNNLKMYDCTLNVSRAYSHIVTASEDHSLITLNPTTLKLEKTTPVEAKGRLVPFVKKNRQNDPEYCIKYIKLGKQYPLSYDMGMFLGMMIGDGWVDCINNAYIACCEPSLQKYISEHFTEQVGMPFTKTAELHSYKSSEGRFSSADMQRFSIMMSSEDRNELGKLIGHGAENKHIPAVVFGASRTCLVGVLCGLLATDGHIGISKTASKKAPIKNIAYHTISGLLRDGIQNLCMRLGVRTRVTPYMGANSKSTCYEIRFCLEDIAALKKAYPDKFVIPVAHKEEALKAICEDIYKGVKNSFQIVPYPRGLFCEFCYAQTSKLYPATIPTASKCGYIKLEFAKVIADHLEKVDWSEYKDPSCIKHSDRTKHTPDQAKSLVDAWIEMVRNEGIGWEVVDKVTPSTCTEGWDCTVPGPYTFTLSTGTVVQDTVNLHVPVSKKAVQDVRLKMMPERNLISARKHEILYKPLKAYLQGLYVATRMDTSKPVKTFNSLLEAKQAYRDSLIDIDTPIVIKGK